MSRRTSSPRCSGSAACCFSASSVLRSSGRSNRQRYDRDSFSNSDFARAMGWWGIAVLVVTGVINLRYRGWLRWDGVLGAPEFWGTATGRALAVKLIAVAVMVAVSATHDFLLGPIAGRATPGSPRAIVLRRRAALLARVNALFGVVVVAAAVRLARGG